MENFPWKNSDHEMSDSSKFRFYLTEVATGKTTTWKQNKYPSLIPCRLHEGPQNGMAGMGMRSVLLPTPTCDGWLRWLATCTVQMADWVSVLRPFSRAVARTAQTHAPAPSPPSGHVGLCVFPAFPRCRPSPPPVSVGREAVAGCVLVTCLDDRPRR